MHKKKKNSNNNFVHDKYKQFNGWQQALEAAQFELLRAQVAEREMKAAIALFKERIKTGEPWPGEASANTVTK